MMDIEAIAQGELISGHLSADTVQKLVTGEGLGVADLMLLLIPLASERAMPGLSGYRVGAVGEGLSGDLYFGANLEISKGPLSLTVHAEQAMVVNAMGYREAGISRLAISAPPCGVCRQFLYELSTAQSLEILLANTQPVQLIDILPGAFGPADLGLEGGLMGTTTQKIKLSKQAPDRMKQLACDAANKSYAPYTGSIAGIAIRLSDDVTFSGFVIENAAYNPSLLPIQVAISKLAMAGRNPQEIVEVVQMEEQDSKVSYADVTEMLLNQIAPKCCFSTGII